MTDASPVSRPVPPPGAFVLRRDAPQERLAKAGETRELAVPVLAAVLGTIMAAWSVWDTAGYLFHYATPTVLCLILVGLLIAAYANLVRALRNVAKARRVVRGLAGLELWIEPEGLTYVCAAGVFPAPWTALRDIFFSDVLGLSRPSPELIVEVAGWGGPLAAYEKTKRPCELQIPLDGLATDRATIAHAVQEISSGRASVQLG